MSTVIYATPVFKKVRYNRKVEEDGGKRDEREEVVYESADGVRDERISFQAHERGPQVQDPPPVQRKSFRAAALCLGVLCLLMMVGLIILSVRHFSVTLEKENLETRYNDLNKTYTELKDNKSSLTVNYKTLSKNHSLLQDEVKMLNNIIEEGKLCPKGWKRFGSSYYFKSTEKKSWYDSRYDCQSRGSDLVSINSKEEQEFVTKFLLSKNEESWIGLRTKQSHQRGPYMYMWEWVDGSSLTETFWARDPYPSQYYHATCCDRQGQWTQTHYNDKKTWICEKQISSFT
ncbi:CD209 antigen-like protein E isoform X1 [Anabas testudineus]|uniref:C-type lectin domain-containing protein n=1 Tax=Anabas testudineus TaxID=64144 RepID=A0A7N6F8S4_ANATE|nr:CD209 antigen-like protein E isoform X1 [Anabas testudineus]